MPCADLTKLPRMQKQAIKTESQQNIKECPLRILAISLACAATILSAQPVFAAPVSRIVAVVNGDMITNRELDKALKPEFVGQQIDPAKNPSLAAMVREAVLDRMINEKILLQQAEKDGIKVTDEQVEKSFEQMVLESQLPREEFLKQMAKEGLTEKQVREKARLSLITQRLMNRNVVSKVVVTEEEVNEYYRQNMAGFASGRARVALLIYPVDVDADKWAADIASGKVSFAEAARKVSVGPNPEGGGDMGYMEIGDMAPGMAEVVSGMAEGSISPVLSLNPNKAQIALLDLEEAEGGVAADAKPDADTAKRIEDILRRPRVQERFKQYTTELRAKALVDIRK